MSLSSLISAIQDVPSCTDPLPSLDPASYGSAEAYRFRVAWIIDDPLGLGLFPLFQYIDLLSDGRHPVVNFLSLRFKIGRGCSQLSAVVLQLIGIVFERINNRF